MDRVWRLFETVLEEAEHNPEFAARLAAAVDGSVPGHDPGPRPTRRGNRRAPGVIDHFAELERGEDNLRRRLEALDVEQLKDIIAERGMDRSKRALSWKN